MGSKNKGGFIGGFDQLRAPDAPTIGVATASSEEVSVAFTTPSNAGTGTISGYIVTAIAGSASTGVSGSSSPITVDSLTNGTEYTFSVIAESEYGYSPASGTVAATPAAPAYALNALGYNNTSGAALNSVERLTISSSGDSADFGDLTEGKYGSGSFCSTTRSIFAGGTTGSNTDVIEYFTAASAGNGTDFGDASTGGRYVANGQINNTTRGVFNLGMVVNTSVNTIEYVTMASTGDSTDFGDLSKPRHWAGGASNATRGLFFAGDDASVGLNDDIDYITIASTGNATDFGDTSHATARCSGCASSTRAVFDEGHTTNAVFSYVTIASTGNATDFGTPVFASGQNKLSGTCSAASATIGLFYGGLTAGGATETNRIQYITIASTGNGTLWGNLAGGGTASLLYGSASCVGSAAATG
jgi:hypothetical protein